MTLSRREWGKIQKSAWLPPGEFAEKLKLHVGEVIEMRLNREKNQEVKLVEVKNGVVTFEGSGKKENVSVEHVSGFTTKEEWYNQRKTP
ncbi:MAG: hypothetical protein M1476_04555 [Candidatus Thermoplasmatota archaeon]|nr:hypothetical protein [Candidatus Thermoplasmatota archaeon]